MECVYWKENKCTACKAFEDYDSCKKPDCMHYTPIARTDQEQKELLARHYKNNKAMSDENLVIFAQFAGHEAVCKNDIHDCEWIVNQYLLIQRKSKYANILYFSDSYVDTIKTMKKHGYKITKAMKRKYNRAKKHSYRKY